MLDRITEMTGAAGNGAVKGFPPMPARATGAFTTPTTGSLAITWALVRARTAS